MALEKIPSPLSKNTDLGVCGAVATFATATAADNCSGVTVSRTSGLANGATFPVGTSAVAERLRAMPFFGSCFVAILISYSRRADS